MYNLFTKENFVLSSQHECIHFRTMDQQHLIFGQQMYNVFTKKSLFYLPNTNVYTLGRWTNNTQYLVNISCLLGDQQGRIYNIIYKITGVRLKKIGVNQWFYSMTFQSSQLRHGTFTLTITGFGLINVKPSALNYFCINHGKNVYFQFEYLCYGSTVIINMFTLTVRWSNLVDIIWRLQTSYSVD